MNASPLSWRAWCDGALRTLLNFVRQNIPEAGELRSSAARNGRRAAPGDPGGSPATFVADIAEPLHSNARDLKAVDGIIDLVYDRSRIRLNRGKEALIRARLGKRMRALGLAALSDYWAYLCSSAGAEEVIRAIDALTTNFTQFLRERDHFEFMVAEALPRMLTERQKRFSIWSAACATGEEPYTIAFQLSERFPPSEGWDWSVRATDISSRVLETAQRGVYAEDRMGSLPGEWVRKYFQRGFGSCAGFWRVKAPLRQRIAFDRMNLLEDGEIEGCYEIIFCRNVMIYFDRPTQERLVNRLSGALAPGGYLFIGRAESLNGLAIPLRCLRPSIYQKPT